MAADRIVPKIDTDTSAILTELDVFHKQIPATGRLGPVLERWRQLIDERAASLGAFAAAVKEVITARELVVVQSQWQEIYQFIDLATKSRSSEATRLRCRAAIVALWGKDCADNYGLLTQPDRQLERLRTCAAKDPYFDTFARLANIVMLRRHEHSLFDNKTRSLATKAFPLELSDLTIIRDLMTGKALYNGEHGREITMSSAAKDGTENMHVNDWLECQDGTILCRGYKLCDLRADHFEQFLLTKDQYGIIKLLPQSESESLREQRLKANNSVPHSPVATPEVATHTKRTPLSSKSTPSRQDRIYSLPHCLMSTTSKFEGAPKGRRPLGSTVDVTETSTKAQQIHSTALPVKAKVPLIGQRSPGHTLPTMIPEEDLGGLPTPASLPLTPTPSLPPSSTLGPAACAQNITKLPRHVAPTSEDHATDVTPQPMLQFDQCTIEQWNHMIEQTVTTTQHPVWKHWYPLTYASVRKQGATPDPGGLYDIEEISSAKFRRLSDTFLHETLFHTPLIIKEPFPDSEEFNSAGYAVLLASHMPNGFINVRTHECQPVATRTSDVVNMINSSHLASQHAGANLLDLEGITNAVKPGLTRVSRFRLLDCLNQRLKVGYTGDYGKKSIRSPYDISASQSFEIFGFSGAFSGAHLDVLGGTWLRNLFGVKLWIVVPQHLMTTADWAEFSRDGPSWNPRGKGRAVILQPGDVFFMPPGIRVIHAVLTLDTCLMTGGMVWDELTILPTLQGLLWVCQNQRATNEAIPYQLSSTLDELEWRITESEISSFLPCADQVSEILKVISDLRNLGCQCEGRCAATCPCYTAERRCTPLCSDHHVGSGTPCMEDPIEDDEHGDSEDDARVDEDDIDEDSEFLPE
jgi:hypothetical protein